MGNIEKHVYLNISQPNNFQLIHVMQGSIDSVTVIAHLFDGNVPYTIPDTIRSYRIMGVLPSGKYLIDGNVTKYDETSVSFQINKNMMARAGNVKFTISLSDASDDSVIETFPAEIMVTGVPGQDTEQTDEIPFITEALEKIEDGISETKDYYNKLISEKGQPNGIAILDENGKVPLIELPDASTTQKGIVQLTDSISSTSTTTAATPNSVKSVKDSLNSEINRATSAENTLTTNLNSEISRAKSAESTLETNLSDEVTRAKGAENTNATAISAETSRATTKENEIANNLSAEITRAKNSEALKAPLASPALAGTPTAPTASAGTNTTQIATTAFTQTAVSNHNSSTTAHTDIRDLIAGLTTRLNTLADSDDTTLDQLSEIVAYIKSNRTLIENVTTNKVNVADIVDNLTSTATNKPLSAKQGKVLNDLISSLTSVVNTKIDTINGDTYIGTSKSGTTGTITHKDVTRSNTASTASPSHGGTFTAVKTVTSDAKGHVTGVDTETVTLPTYTALKNPNAISINGKSYDGSSAVNVGTIGAAYGGTGKTTLNDSANALINSLSTGDSTPSDTDYYVAQYAGGGTTTTTYHRRPISTLWNYIKSKLANVATSGNYNDLSNKPTIPTKVGELTNDKNYATKTEFTKAIDDIEIGGRNLYLGTKDFSGDWKSKRNWSVSSETYKGFTVMGRAGTWNGLYQPVEGVFGEVYTFSGYVKKTGGITYVFTNGFGGETTNHGAHIGTKLNEWEHFSVTTTVSTSGPLGFRVENNSQDGKTYICGLKLEKGDKATDWTPAPEDTDAEIQAVNNKLTTNMLKPTLSTTTLNGVTCTNNGDGTYTLKGTATQSFTLPVDYSSKVTLSEYGIKKGNYYKLIGCPSGGSTEWDKYKLYLNVTGNGINYNDSGNGIIFSPTDDDLNSVYNVGICIARGFTLNNLTFKPMITTNLNATYDDFVPYTGNSGSLNEDVADIQSALDEKASSSHTHNYAGSSSAGGSANSAIYSNKIADRGVHTETASGTTANSPTTGMLETSGLFMTRTYNDSNTPVNYGNIINIAGSGTGQLLCEWSGYDSTLGHLYYRSHRDTSTGGWSSWGQVAFTTDNVASATKLATARTIALTGSVTGSGTFDGSGNLSIATTTNHTHSYAGSSSAGGSATSAVKLDSSAGSATQPVYFSGGKPVACTYTLGKSVPSNAVFTDTWRGIQNNLTSDSTTDSLSAAQGKVLNDTKVGFANVTASEIAKTNNKPYFGNVQDEDIGIGNGLYYNVINFGSYSKGNHRSQIAMPYQNNITDSDMYIRTDNGGTWRPWRKIIHSGNIGSQNVNIANQIKCVQLTGGDGNNPGWRLIAAINIGDWTNVKANFMVQSRHQGNGLLCIAAGCNSSAHNKDTTYVQIKYFGNTNCGNTITANSYIAYISSDYRTVYLFWYYWDYSPTLLTPISNNDFTISNGTWMSSIDDSTYGTLSAQTEINTSLSADSAARLNTSAVGSATQPVYFTNGNPVACTYTLGKSVPSDAKFTDTTYNEATKEHNGLMSAEDKTVIENFKSGGVTGVKGANETSYRSGNVSLSVDDIGAAAKEQIGDHTVKTNVPENAVFTDTTYDVVTEKTNGLMSSTDKKNLDDLLDPYNRNMLADGTDFHEVTKPGSYQFHHTKTYINNPPMVNGFVDVKTYGNIVKQIAYRQGTIGTNDHEIYECTGNKAIDDWSDWVRILTTKDACGYVGGAAKATASYTLNTSHVYLIIGTGHKPSTSIDSLSCGEYIYYANSQWNRTQIFASSFPAMGITGNTLIVGYSSTTGANSCDRHILLRVK